MPVFDNLYTTLQKLMNPVVKKHTYEVLQGIYRCLYDYTHGKLSPYCLPKLHIVEQNDTSALIEWNFQSFRVGFSVEPNVEESYYYIVSADKSIGSFSTRSQEIGNDLDAAIRTVVRFVLENTR